MARALIDRTGSRFQMLTVISRAENRGKSTYWLCRCDCGIEKEIAGASLNSTSHTISCGCHGRNVSRQMMIAMSTKHGKSRSQLYGVWKEMRYRCNTVTGPHYRNYGGRGIRICRQWDNSFEAFRDWALKNGYSSELTIDRINNNGNYTPKNCRWANMEVQSNNRRSSLLIEYKGETMSATQWARKLGIKKETVFSRIRKGLPIEQVFSTLVSPLNKPQYQAAPSTQVQE